MDKLNKLIKQLKTTTTTTTTKTTNFEIGAEMFINLKDKTSSGLFSSKRYFDI
jgi:hypothetical protein